MVLILGVVLLLVGYVLPVPAFVATLGWILLLIGVVLFVAASVGHPVGRSHWY